MSLLSTISRPIGLSLLVLTSHLTLTGCATVGKEFPASRVMEIKIGETTINDVQATFGPPWRVGSENGAKTWSYGKYQYRLFGEPSTQDLIIRFNSNGIVQSYNFNTTTNK